MNAVSGYRTLDLPTEFNPLVLDDSERLVGIIEQVEESFTASSPILKNSHLRAQLITDETLAGKVMVKAVEIDRLTTVRWILNNCSENIAEQVLCNLLHYINCHSTLIKEDLVEEVIKENSAKFQNNWSRELLGYTFVTQISERKVGVVKLMLKTCKGKITSQMLKIGWLQATKDGCLDVIKVMIEKGVIKDEQEIGEGFVQVVKKGDLEILRFFFDKGDVFRKIDGYYLAKGIIEAKQNEQPEVVRFILERGLRKLDARVLSSIVNWGREKGYPEIIQIILDERENLEGHWKLYNREKLEEALNLAKKTANESKRRNGDWKE